MIKITIELWPYGDSTKSKTIAEGIIYNDGTGTHEIGNYKSEFYNGARGELTTSKIGSATVSDWERRSIKFTA